MRKTLFPALALAIVPAIVLAGIQSRTCNARGPWGEKGSNLNCCWRLHEGRYAVDPSCVSSKPTAPDVGPHR